MIPRVADGSVCYQTLPQVAPISSRPTLTSLNDLLFAESSDAADDVATPPRDGMDGTESILGGRYNCCFMLSCIVVPIESVDMCCMCAPWCTACGLTIICTCCYCSASMEATGVASSVNDELNTGKRTQTQTNSSNHTVSTAAAEVRASGAQNC